MTGSTRVLAHRIVTAPGARPGRRLLILHGIYGAGRNWGAVARRLVRARPEWSVTLADLRSHGRSPSMAPHTVTACASDLEPLAERMGGAADAVLGHSFGGKVALLHARRAWDRGAGTPAQAWVIDSSPASGRPGGAAWRMLAVLRRRSGPFAGRAEAAAAVEAEGFSETVARWMATNAAPREAGGWGWGLDADEMEAYLRDYFRTDAWGALESPPPGAEVHVVRALGSRVFEPADVRRIRAAGLRAGRVFLHEARGGHWVHVENPDAIHRLLAARLPGRS